MIFLQKYGIIKIQNNCTASWEDILWEKKQEHWPEYTRLGPGFYPRDTVCNLEIWRECLGRPREQMTKKDSARIAMIMARVKGWEKAGDYQYHPVYGKQRVYQRIVEQA